MKFENRKTLLSLIHNKKLEKTHIEEALKLAGIPPCIYSFLSFLRLIFIWVGALSLVMALLLFMAFNWQDLGRLTKFMMVEVSMLTSVSIYLVASKYERVQQIALMLASITLGILLALIGQTYQTGADPWQLFALWALLMIPWAIVAKASALWILWIILVNVAAVLYYQKLDLSWSLFGVRDDLLLLLFGINVFLWLIWHYLAQKYKTFKQLLLIYFLAFFTVLPISVLVNMKMYKASDGIVTLGYMLLYMVFSGLMYYVYRVRQIDIYMMSLFAISLFFFILNVIIRYVPFNEVSDTIIFPVLIIIIVGLTIVIVSWIKKLKRELYIRKELDAKSSKHIR